MRPIKVSISNDTSADYIIGNLESRISDALRSSPEYGLIFPQIKSCVEDFSERARKLALEGTTIKIKKEFLLGDTPITIVLEYPKKVGSVDRILSIFQG